MRWAVLRDRDYADLRLLREHLQAFPIEIRVRGEGSRRINRVRRAGIPGQDGRELFPTDLGEHGNVQAQIGRMIEDESILAAGDSDDPDTHGLWSPRVPEELDRLDPLVGILAKHDAFLPEDRTLDLIAPGKATSVRGGCGSSRLAPAGLDHDQRVTPPGGGIRGRKKGVPGLC